MAKKMRPVTPGEILMEEFLKPMKISQTQLANEICVPPNRINQIIHNKREITADTALRLGRFFDIEPEFWLNLQSRFNLKMAREVSGKQIAADVRRYRSIDSIPDAST